MRNDEQHHPNGSGKAPSHLRRLVETSLTNATGEDLMELIMKRRETPKVDGKAVKPTPYYTIAHELVQLTGVYITHEAVRRWHRAAEQEQIEAANAARAAELASAP